MRIFCPFSVRFSSVVFRFVSRSVRLQLGSIRLCLVSGSALFFSIRLSLGSVRWFLVLFVSFSVGFDAFAARFNAVVVCFPLGSVRTEFGNPTLIQWKKNEGYYVDRANTECFIRNICNYEGLESHTKLLFMLIFPF